MFQVQRAAALARANGEPSGCARGDRRGCVEDQSGEEISRTHLNYGNRAAAMFVSITVIRVILRRTDASRQ